MNPLLRWLGFGKTNNEIAKPKAEPKTSRRERKTTLVRLEKAIQDEPDHAEAEVSEAMTKIRRSRAQTQSAFTETISDLDEEIQKSIRSHLRNNPT